MKHVNAGIVLGLLVWAQAGWGQIYQAGQAARPHAAPTAAWDVSLSVYRSPMHVVDPVQEDLFAGETGLSARGLYRFSDWLAGGMEGGISRRKDFPLQNTYRHLYYGAVTKWIVTPQTQPRVYLLLGGGISRRKLSYAGMWAHSVRAKYVTAGIGTEVDIWKSGYIGLETQARYNTHRTLDNFTALERRLEVILGLRAGLRF